MSMLERLPGWARRLDELSGHFSEAGLNGLLDYHAETNTLGELLARGEVTTAQVKEFLDGRKPLATVADAEVILRTDPHNFWAGVWHKILDEKVVRERKIIIPPFPKLKAKTQIAITGGLGWWIPVYLPVEVTESDYPADFVKPEWGQHLDVSRIQRRPLPGRWVIVETIPKPNWDDPNGYGNGNDPLAQALGLTSRFSHSWDELHETHLPKAAKLLGLSKKAVRLTTAEEWNMVGNLFLWLNTNRNMTLHDLGSTNSWEWAENSYGGAARLLAGLRAYGGLADVRYYWHVRRHGDVGFRVLAVL